MTNDEILVFYQYDRLATQPSDLWHCAISIPIKDDDSSAQDNDDANINYFNTTTHNNSERLSSHLRVNDASTTSSSRESFDIRALIVFDEVIDNDKDRFHPERVRPMLSFEESGCFCDEQAIKTNIFKDFSLSIPWDTIQN